MPPAIPDQLVLHPNNVNLLSTTLKLMYQDEVNDPLLLKSLEPHYQTSRKQNVMIKDTASSLKSWDPIREILLGSGSISKAQHSKFQEMYKDAQRNTLK
ncbi:hypothetical protein CDAR_391901 [Caerostris darwini]|uniref:Uncharacterized protein n=1 Tax=Caerostris darwini TaxID=1538125 RepID=A0AAV4S024_9ARAC|nr:hypothetical protein CDAR_391901 [Caerostris darwini]